MKFTLFPMTYEKDPVVSLPGIILALVPKSTQVGVHS